MNISFNEEEGTGSYDMAQDGFDEMADYLNYADSFIEQSNDILGEDINDELAKNNLTIAYGIERAAEFSIHRNHTYTTINFPIKVIKT